MKNIQRHFLPCEEWVYLKIYTGVKTADLILLEYLNPIIEELINTRVADQWFFIRYYDTDFHIRLRLHASNKEDFYKIITPINNRLRELLDNGLIWKVQMETYTRELERYGFLTIEQSESIFFYDSLMIINALNIFENSDNPNLKWIWALAATDSFMNDFNLSLENRLNLMKILKTDFGNELGVDGNLKKQLSRKYQKYKKEINRFMDNTADKSIDINNLLIVKSDNIKEAVNSIKLSIHDPSALLQFISSHIHMTMNRLFRTKNRHNEFVCYEFLYSYYDSKIARHKKNTVMMEK